MTTESDAVRVAACQVPADVTRPPSSAGLERAVAAAAADGASLVVLPELAFTGYCFRDRDEVAARAEPADGPSLQVLRRLSAEHDVVLACGLPPLAGAGGIYNAAALVDRGEVLAIHRKTHLWDRENVLFARADDPPPVCRTSRGAVALLICYELEFPEMVRGVAARGAEIVAAPVNWPVTTHRPDQEAVEVAHVRAAAAAYGVHVVVADRCGVERGTEWVGGSVVVDAEGYAVAGPLTRPGRAARPGIAAAEVSLAAARRKRRTAHNDLIGDRRPELYREPGTSGPPPG